jgi:hypothetical protein
MDQKIALLEQRVSVILVFRLKIENSAIRIPDSAIEGSTGLLLRKKKTHRPYVETRRGRQTQIELGVTRDIGIGRLSLRSFGREIGRYFPQRAISYPISMRYCKTQSNNKNLRPVMWLAFNFPRRGAVLLSANRL